MATFERTFSVRWADLDPNFHLRHSVYADFGADVRMKCLESNGFSLDRLRELGVGPILFSEKLDYLREVRAGESVTVNMMVVDLSPDGRKWSIKHEITKGDGQKAAELLVTGAWFDTKARKVSVPPAELDQFMRSFR